MAETVDVAVIGAGVVGCSVAYYLANRGVSVHINEREAIGSGASAHATGSLSLLGAEFSPGPTFQLALAGYREFPSLVPELEEATGIDLLYQRRPSLRLALDEDEEIFIKSLMPWQQQQVAMRWIGGDEVRQIEPRLTELIRGAVYEEESAQLDSYRLNLALAQAAEKKGTQLKIREVKGLIVEPGPDQKSGRVTGLRTNGGYLSCGFVVLAAGVWSADFGDQLNFQVPVRPLKGERLLLRYSGEPLPVLISSPKRGHMISRLDRLLSVGSTGGRDYDQQESHLGAEYDRQPTDAARMELMRLPRVGRCRIGPAAGGVPAIDPRRQTHHRPRPRLGGNLPVYRPHHQRHPSRAYHWADNSRLRDPRPFSGARRAGGSRGFFTPPVPRYPIARFHRQQSPGRGVR